MDVHLAVCRLMTERLQALGLMKGDVDASVAAGAHALFLPHGLGHAMGMDVHDMEALGQVNVGYDDETRPSDQFGLASLRFGRRLEVGHVVTDEPGIYFIPDLIDLWRAEGTNSDFLNFDAIESYKDFGGIRSKTICSSRPTVVVSSAQNSCPITPTTSKPSWHVDRPAAYRTLLQRPAPQVSPQGAAPLFPS